MSNIQEPIIIYDIISVPKNAGMSMKDVLHVYNTTKTLLWDSSNKGKEPRVFNDENQEIKIQDINET